MPILVRQKGSKWQRADDVVFADETQLQKMLYESPELISLNDQHPAVFIREAGLPGSGYTDLLGVDVDGNILIVETKLAKNSEIRRKVIGQILEYAAYLWNMSYEEFDGMFLQHEETPLSDLMPQKLGQALPEGFRDKVAANLRSGTFHLFIAVDQINDELEKIIAYLSTRGSGLKLQALELRTYKLGDLEILAPQRHGDFVATTETISPAPTITVEQAIDNCPNEQGRTIFRLLVDNWKRLGHEVRPGTVGVAFRADVGGTMQSIFWGSRQDLQAAFSTVLSRGAPPDAVQQFRTAVSRLPGFSAEKFLKDAQPIAKFQSLTEAAARSFVEAADAMVRNWGNSITG